jgi:hypothetical protein
MIAINSETPNFTRAAAATIVDESEANNRCSSFDFPSSGSGIMDYNCIGHTDDLIVVVLHSAIQLLCESRHYSVN